MPCLTCGAEHPTQSSCPTLVRSSPALGVGCSDSLLGTTLGRFRLTQVLGRGGMGTVYLGEHVEIGSRMAIKVLHQHLAANSELTARFLAEARAVNRVHHQNLAQVMDIGTAPPNLHYLVMEFLEGRPLASMAQGPVPAPLAIPILGQICDALGAVHRAGIVHRDLKPENVLLVSRGEDPNFVKLLDFGIAKLLGAGLQGGDTSAGILVGTPEYMAPEQTSSQPVDARTDVYAVGVVSYLLATGRLPFSGSSVVEILIAQREQVPPSPRELNPSIPRAWCEATLRALAKRPEDRFQSADELAKALRAALRPGGGLCLQARLLTEAGEALGEAKCTELARGGAYLSVTGPLPPLRSRISLTLGGGLRCACEVVRQVAPEQAQRWQMEPGVGVQFLEVSPDFPQQLARLLEGIEPSANDDQEAAQLLARYQPRTVGDLYSALDLSPEAELAAVRRRARESELELSRMRSRPLSPLRAEQLERVLARVRKAGEVLGVAKTRAEYDSRRGNFRGVLHCLSSGLTVTELEALRTRHLSEHPEAPRVAQGHAVVARGLERSGKLRAAVAEYEQALLLDPLNLELLKPYVRLRALSELAHTPGPRGASPTALKVSSAAR